MFCINDGQNWSHGDEDRFKEDAKRKLATLVEFVESECIPAEAVYHSQISINPETRWKYIPPIMEELKTKAKKLGLWNLFLSKAHYPEYVEDLTWCEKFTLLTERSFF